MLFFQLSHCLRPQLSDVCPIIIARYLLDIGASVRFGPMELGHPINALDTAIDARMFNLASDLVTKRGMDPFSAEGRMKAISKFIKAAERDLRQNGRPSSSLGNNPALTSPTPIEQLILSGTNGGSGPSSRQSLLVMRHIQNTP